MLAPILAALVLVQDAPPAVPEVPAHVETHVSPSGAFRLRVERAPGAERTSCRLARVDPARAMDLSAEPVTVWTRVFDFAWDEVRVTDLGHVAGVAYTGGGRDAWRDSELIVAIVGLEGELLGEHRAKRRRSRVLGEAADPKVAGTFVLDVLQRFVVRVADPDPERGDEEWWPFELTTGAPLEPLHPRERLDEAVRLARVAGAAPIEGTPLTLVQWWVAGDRPGVRFAALDGAGAPVWELSLPRAYAVLPGEAERLRSLERRDGFRADALRSFTLVLAAEGQEASFDVRRGGADQAESWFVHEQQRARVARELESPPLPELALDKLGEVGLGEDVEGNEVYSLVSFAFRGERIELVREESPGLYVSVLAERDGRVLAHKAFERLPAAEEGSDGGPDLRDVRWFPLDGRRWLVAQPIRSRVEGGADDEHAVRLLVADASDGRVEESAVLAVPEVVGGAPIPNGFAALAGVHPARGEPYLFGFVGSLAEPAWTVTRGARELMPWAAALAPAPGGSLAVLDGHRDTLRFYTSAGELYRTVELRDKWLSRPHRPYGLTAGPDGRFVVRDAAPPAVRTINLGGYELSRLDLQGVGRSATSESRSLLRLGPDGELWYGDRDRLVRLDEAGRAHPLMRGLVDRTELRHIGAVYIDFAGRICALDALSGAVYVFDHDGRALRVCRPEDPDYRVTRASRLSVAADGSIYVSLGPGDRESPSAADHAAFGPDGGWLGFCALGSLDVLFDPRGDRRWVRNGALKLVGEDGRSLREIPRLPGGRLLEGTQAVAPDGSLAVVTDRQVALYSREGELVEAFAVALTVVPRKLAFGASGWLVVSEDEAANLIRLRDRRVWRFAHDAGDPSGVTYGFSPDGKELWAVERDRRRLHRYALAGAR